MEDYGFVQWGEAGSPMFTQKVPIKNTFADNWYALIGGRWHRVYIQVKRCYVVIAKQRRTIVIEGV